MGTKVKCFLPTNSRGEPHIFGWKIFGGTVFFVLFINPPIHETLIKTKVSLLSNVKIFKFALKLL